VYSIFVGKISVGLWSFESCYVIVQCFINGVSCYFCFFYICFACNIYIRHIISDSLLWMEGGHDELQYYLRDFKVY
jgi:hypothetical protein